MGFPNIENFHLRGRAEDLFPGAVLTEDTEKWKISVSNAIYRFLQLRSYQCSKNETHPVLSSSMTQELLEAIEHGQIGLEIIDRAKISGRHITVSNRSLWPPAEHLEGGRTLSFDSTIVILQAHQNITFEDLLVPQRPGVLIGDQKLTELYAYHEQSPFSLNDIATRLETARMELTNFTDPGTNVLLDLGRITTHTAYSLGLPDLIFPQPQSS